MYFSKPLLNRFVIIEALTYTHGINVDGVYTPKLSTYRIYYFYHHTSRMFFIPLDRVGVFRTKLLYVAIFLTNDFKFQ